MERLVPLLVVLVFLGCADATIAARRGRIEVASPMSTPTATPAATPGPMPRICAPQEKVVCNPEGKVWICHCVWDLEKNRQVGKPTGSPVVGKQSAAPAAVPKARNCRLSSSYRGVSKFLFCDVQAQLKAKLSSPFDFFRRPVARYAHGRSCPSDQSHLRVRSNVLDWN